MKKSASILLIFSFVFLLAGFTCPKPRKYICPVKYEDDVIIRCDGRGEGFFGAERSGGRMHNGIDLYAKVGTPVLASRSGKVIAAKRNPGMGKYVIIRHRGNITTVYGHLNRTYVAKGQYVNQGKAIGSVGRTGNARYSGIQPHLHFEIKKRGVPQDPLNYIIDKSADPASSVRISLQE